MKNEEEKMYFQNKNNIYSFGSLASNLIKSNSIIQQTIEFYQNKIKESKSKFEKYFKENNKIRLKEILLNDMKILNKELNDYNNKYKQENENINIKNKELKIKIQTNLFELNEEKEKVKEDNFILSNENLYKDVIINILKEEKANFLKYDYFPEEYRTVYDETNNQLMFIMEQNLNYFQKQLILCSRHHNNFSNKINLLDKTKNNLKDQINDYASTKTTTNIKLKSRDLLNNYYLISKKKQNKLLLNEEDIYFSPFESSSSEEESDNNNLKTDNNILAFEKKIFPKYNMKINMNKNREKTMNFIPKLNLEQIEYNKVKVHISKKNENKKKNKTVKINLQEKINEMKSKIIDIFAKNNKLKKIIKKFEKFEQKINKKKSKMEETVK